MFGFGRFRGGLGLDSGTRQTIGLGVLGFGALFGFNRLNEGRREINNGINDTIRHGGLFGAAERGVNRFGGHEERPIPGNIAYNRDPLPPQGNPPQQQQQYSTATAPQTYTAPPSTPLYVEPQQPKGPAPLDAKAPDGMDNERASTLYNEIRVGLKALGYEGIGKANGGQLSTSEIAAMEKFRQDHHLEGSPMNAATLRDSLHEELDKHEDKLDTALASKDFDATEKHFLNRLFLVDDFVLRGGLTAEMNAARQVSPETASSKKDPAPEAGRMGNLDRGMEQAADVSNWRIQRAPSPS